MVHPERRVALLLETSNAYARGLLRGIRAYTREHGPWSFVFGEHSRGMVDASWVKQFAGDGVIARIENRRMAAALRHLRVPVIDVSAARLLPGLNWVETDDKAIAQLAAQHLLACGFKHFGYCGDSAFNWSKWRAQYFQQFLNDAGHTCTIHDMSLRADGPKAWAREQGAMAGWVRRLTKSVGIMACYDGCGQRLLQACRQAGASVPYEVAVIGVDNDELLCDLSDPPLSSVIPDTWRGGYEAAEILDRLMSGERVGAVERRIPPVGVAERQSTNTLAISDRDIARAISYIREHACHGIQVGDVLREVPLSRRILEKRFQQAVGHSPHEEILRVRVGRIKQLLVETDLSLPLIAERAGFVHPEYASVVFKRETGISPGAYRAQCGASLQR